MRPCIADDEDGELGFVIGMAEASVDEVTAFFVEQARQDWALLYSADDLAFELKGYRPLREDKPGEHDDATEIQCAPGEEPTVHYWVAKLGTPEVAP